MRSTAIQRPRLVKPRPLRWYHRAAATAVFGLIRSLSATVRYEWPGAPGYLGERGSRPVIYGFWHNRLALSLEIHRLFVRSVRPQCRLAAMVSASKDGGILARILEHAGVQPVRGSTSRRGPQALLELTSWAERGYDLAITPDGPRGPRYRVQPGVISLAQVTGLPILPVSYRVDWRAELRSWDRFQVPVPFGRCVITLGQLIWVARKASDDERETLREQLEAELLAITHD